MIKSISSNEDLNLIRDLLKSVRVNNVHRIQKKLLDGSLVDTTAIEIAASVPLPVSVYMVGQHVHGT